MIYTVTLKVLVNTPYGELWDHYNIGNVHADDMPVTLQEAAEHGWPLASVQVSLHKSYVDSLPIESPVGELA
jgi:hypothetical protein